MQDKELYQQLLGLKAPWTVEEVELRMQESTVRVTVGHEAGAAFLCPECAQQCTIHDHRPRRWRDLDTCGFTTLIEAEVPRVRCEQHGVHQIRVPWAEAGSQFTALFEAMAISWLQACSLSAVAEKLRISWDEAWGIMSRAVDRGLERRESTPIRQLAIDETSFRKRHDGDGTHRGRAWGGGGSAGRPQEADAKALVANE